MSRLIVKNLPNGLKEERLRNIFGGKGQVTDCALKYTRSGKFRNFAFVGYKTEEEAQAALKALHKTFLDTSRIEVEIARDFGDQNKPRPWSKYSKESSAGQKLLKKATGSTEKVEKKKEKKAKDEVVDELLGELKDDPEFQEFLDAHQNIGAKAVWGNDTKAVHKQYIEPGTSGKGQVANDNSSDDSDDSDGSDGDDSGIEERESQSKGDSDVKEEKDTIAKKKNVSDLEYLKSKIAATKSLLSDSDSSDSDMEVDSRTAGKKPGEQGGTTAAAGGEEEEDVHIMKMKGLPMSAGESNIKEFFMPIDPVRIRIPRNARKKTMGIAYVGFKTEKEVDEAMGRNKNFIGGKRIFLKKMQQEEAEAEGIVEVDKPRPWEMKHQEAAEETEGIAESGRLFVRNLAYSCCEDDLEKLFGKYGALTEVSLPLDSLTKKLKGFAFVTYMIPEHAVKAYAELDGKVFQGRMLHILPSREKKDDTEINIEGLSFKKQKQLKMKATAGSSHNWNSLFLGANAVVDVMADKYGASKDQILDDDMKGSVGVRLALGETQIVSETREFLLENGVSLDSFSQANAARSKSVILVKNLPAGTTATELEAVFAKHGTLGRVVMPPSGITAIIEYMSPTEAKAGFTRLAYTKFRHVPLYLEWAPMEVFKAPEATVSDAEKQMGHHGNKEISKKAKELTPEDSSEEEDEVGSTLFVKNISFDTTDQDLMEVFNRCCKVKTATIARKKDLKNPGQFLSMGYGFVEFKDAGGAQKAVKELQHTELDGHQLEVKISNRTTVQSKTTQRKKQKKSKQTSTKILVKNIPFEAHRREVEELFKVFGELKFVRLPKKLSGTGSHRGFGFVDFLTRQDAKRAFQALCHSTHLYGRRLVLEWADTASEEVDELRKRTAEHFHEDGGKKKLTKAGLMEDLQMANDIN